MWLTKLNKWLNKFWSKTLNTPLKSDFYVSRLFQVLWMWDGLKDLCDEYTDKWEEKYKFYICIVSFFLFVFFNLILLLILFSVLIKRVIKEV